MLGGRTPQLEDLPRLPYTDKVVKESMRMYPPAWSLARTTIKELDLSGYRIPIGSNVVMSPWIMHRDPRFFEQPEKFNPDRWTPKPPSASPDSPTSPSGRPAPLHRGVFRHDGSSSPTAAIAQRFQLRLVPGHPVAALPSITLRPKHGMMMSLAKK